MLSVFTFDNAGSNRFKRKRFSTFHFDNAVFSQPAGRDFATLPATYCSTNAVLYSSIQLTLNLLLYILFVVVLSHTFHD